MSSSRLPSFYWHDYETWGEVPSVDRPSQFAGVRTDWDLNPVGEPLMIYAKPAPDFLPKPDACLITGLSPYKALELGLPECDFTAKIHRELSRPGTCGVGYNSIRFDDEVTRHTLYRNFYDPYEREWRNGNSRWDLIDVVRMTHALRPEGIQWPTREDGTPSFRLEELTKANGLSHESAHDALSDVYATIELARLIKNRQPRLFEYALSMRFKRTVSPLIDPDDPKPVLNISSKFGPKHRYTGIVFPLMVHPTNSNAVVCFNLSCRPDLLLSLDSAALKERLYTPSDARPEGWEPLGLKSIHLNKSPMVLPIAMLDADVNTRLGIDKELCESHWRWFMALTKEQWAVIRERILELFNEGFSNEKDVDQLLYAGFFSDADKVKMAQIRREGVVGTNTLVPLFDDLRLNAMLLRYKARNFPDQLLPDEAQQWNLLRIKKIEETSGSWNARLTLLLADPELQATKRDLLEELRRYGQELGA